MVLTTHVDTIVAISTRRPIKYVDLQWEDQKCFPETDYYLSSKPEQLAGFITSDKTCFLLGN